MRLKQRIVRILVHEIVADVDEECSEIVLLNWTGGRHSELRVKKNATEHRHAQVRKRSPCLGDWPATSATSRSRRH